MSIDIQRNLLIINSNDKTSGNSSDFQYSLGDVSLEIDSVAVKQVSIPHTHQNINENNNDLILELGTEFTLDSNARLNYTINGITSYVPVSPGTYTLNSLLTELNNSQTFGEFDYDPVPNRVTFTITSASVNINGVDFLTGGSPEIMSILGFVLPVNVPTGVGSNITGTNAPTYAENNVFNITIPTGQYTTTTLLPVVMNELNLFFTTTATGIVNSEGKVEINAPTDTWLFRSSGVATSLGFETLQMTFQNTQTAQGIPDLYGTRYVYVASKVLSNGYNALQSRGNKTSILAAVPVCSAQGGMDKWENPYLVKKDYPQPINTNSLDIQILDDTGNVVDLQGVECVIILEVWCKTKL